jgi:hypothetical protein
MRSKVMLCAVLGLATAAFAKDPKAYQSGKLLQMNSVACGTSEKDSKSFAGEVIGTDSGSRKTQQLLCQEYVLQGDQVVYHIRPRDEKHPALLAVGGQAQFRLEKDKIKMHMEDSTKESEYVVVSMTPRTDSSAADATSQQPNHLQ